MNWKRVKQKWNLAKTLCLVGTSFWLIETTYFLIAYGWHWKAINEAEKMCDNIVGCFWAGGLILTGIVMTDIIEYLFKCRKYLDETSTELKKLRVADVRCQRERLLAFAGWLYGNLDKEVERMIVDDYLKGK